MLDDVEQKTIIVAVIDAQGPVSDGRRKSLVDPVAYADRSEIAATGSDEDGIVESVSIPL